MLYITLKKAYKRKDGLKFEFPIFFFCKKSGQKIMAKPEFTPRPDGEATEEFAADQLADLTSAPQTVRRVCCRMTGGGVVRNYRNFT